MIHIKYINKLYIYIYIMCIAIYMYIYIYYTNDKLTHVKEC